MRRWLAEFEAALARADLHAAAGLFVEDAYWRDLVAFTWNIRTSEGRDGIRSMLSSMLQHVSPRRLRFLSHHDETSGWFSFETAAGRGTGHIRMREGRCWTLLTALQELKGFEEKRGPTRIRGTEHGVFPGRKSWLQKRQEEKSALGITVQPYVLIVGGGQNGLALAARLKRLDVPAVVVEKNAHPGDSWRNRYQSLVLHDPVWYDHLPYLPFPEHWPVFTPKDQIGDWLQMYATVMELNFWGSSECKRARFDEDAGVWEVLVEREGRAFTLKPTHLVLATGMSGFPNMPRVPGAERFRGALHHSSAHPGGGAWRGKKCVVIGSNNSAHDIAADLWEHGAEKVTMVQRSSTVVVRSEALMRHAWGKLYSEAALERGITTAVADLLTASVPFRLLPSFQKPIYERIREEDKELYAGLERVGFLYDFGEDGSGIHSTYLRRGAGYYIDVGASQLVIDGRIALEHGEIEYLDEHSVRLRSGEALPADLVVFATGYGSMNEWAAKLISQEVADRVGKCWGLGSGTRHDPGPWVGELRNMWKPTPQPNLWFQGGNLMQARHYSLYLALQLKARYQGLPTPVCQ